MRCSRLLIVFINMINFAYSYHDYVTLQKEFESKYLKYAATPISIDDYSYYYSKNLKEEKCDRYKCFNPLRCEINTSRQLMYYVYPPLTFIDADDNLLYSTRSMMSHKYQQLLQSIILSSRFTLDPNQACIFVTSIDVTWFGHNNHSLLASILENLPYWKFIDGRPGTNHMIISLDLTQDLNLLKKTIGHSILVASNHNTWTFRPDFDYSIPHITATKNYDKKTHKWKIVFTQYSSLNLRQRTSLDKLSNVMGDDILVTGYNCYGLLEVENGEISEHSTNSSIEENYRCSLDSRQRYIHPDLLSLGQYCLILDVDSDSPTSDSGHYLIIESILHSCIPIVTNDLKLPYHSSINWNSMVLRVTNVYTLESLINLISSIDSNSYENMIRQAQNFRLNHLQSVGQMVETMLRYYDNLVYPEIFLSSSACSKPLALEIAR